jgi:hypothetical protein
MPQNTPNQNPDIAQLVPEPDKDIENTEDGGLDSTPSPAMQFNPYGSRAIDPRMALPAHLQGKSFEEDVWDRVKNSPLRNPNLYSKKLDIDAGTREIVRQLLLAASEREKEVLLHGQARVFREILGRTFDAMRAFLGNSLISEHTLRSILPFQRTISEPETASGAEGGGDSTSKTKFDAAKVISKLLTPKYVLLILSAILTVATGYSRIQVKNLQDAIKSYETAAGATDDLRGRLEQEIASSKLEREKSNAHISDLNAQLMVAQNNSREASIQIATLQKENEILKQEAIKATADLKTAHDQQSGDIKVVQSKLDDLQAKFQNDETSLAKAQAELTADAEWKKTMLATSDTREGLLSNQAIEIDTLRQQSSKQMNEITALGVDRTLLGFAETFIQNVSGEADSWGNMDKGKVQQWKEEFTSAKKNLGH